MNIHRAHISSTSSTFTYQLNHPLLVSGISITGIQIPLTYYNIPEGSSSLTVGVDDFETVYTPVSGNYSADDLITELNRILNGVATVTYSKITGKTSITAAANTTITLAKSPLAERLGFVRTA